MNLAPGPVAAIAFAYLVLLFGVAYWAEKRKDRGRSLISNPYVYSLSIAVFCTSWTFYGSVGRAATSGFGFLAVYIGPTLIAFTWWSVLRKMVRVARENHITSIADFIASRYGKSGKIGALVTIMAIWGIAPYIALQLKAVASTFDILTRYTPHGFLGQHVGSDFVLGDTAFLVALVLGVFGGMYGARSLDPSERHEGMVAVIALESLVKLVALVIVGAFVTWGVFDGFRDILSRMAAHPVYSYLLTFGRGAQNTYGAWFTLLYLSLMAVMLLPRQFHMMVVENCEEEHIGQAMWLFPLYLFLINFFVVPIAFGGLLSGQDPTAADTFVLRVPLAAGQPLLALVAFVGGLSAATGMVVVASVTLSTMFLNHLLMPCFLRLGWPKNFAPYLIHIKRIGIIAVILLGYTYYRVLGDSFRLVDIGLISFGAAAQWAPALIGGLYWRHATANGAASGLTLGFVSWGYMFLLPALCQAGWLPASIVDAGPGGIWLLRPTAFLGLEGMDVWSHGLFWSFFFNVGAFVAVSFMTHQNAAEQSQASRFVDALGRGGARRTEFRLARAPSVGEFEDLLAKFIGRDKARDKIRSFFGGRPVASAGVVSDDILLELRSYVERTLAGAVGSAAASNVVERYLAIKGTTLEEIFDVFGAVSLSLEESREELESRVRELAVLFEASKRVAATLDEEKAISSVLDLLAADFGLDCQGVFLLTDGALEPKLTRGFSQAYVTAVRARPDHRSYLGQAVTDRRTVFLSDVDLVGKPKPVDIAENPDLQCLIATPILQENQVLGALMAGSVQRKGYFSGKFLEAFEALASELALAISNARLYGEVRELNRTLEAKVRERTQELQAANQNLQALDRMKSEFLANMSHELRTPMNSILGYTQLVLDGVDGSINEQQEASLRRVENNARHLLQLINDILDLSKIEAGRMELDLHEFDVVALVREVLDDLQAMAGRKGLECILDVGAGDFRIVADPNRVREVLNNLVNNAIKFTDHGEVRVEVIPRPSENREGVEVVVADTGIGIPEESLGEVFVAFKQLDGSATRAHGGTGLGLSIAKKLLEMHGGSIRLESRPGEGSRFTVWLPRRAFVVEGG